MTLQRKLAVSFLLSAAFMVAACGPISSATPGSTSATTPSTTPPVTPMPEGIALLTEAAPSQACMEALARGTLVPDPRSGLALASPSGERNPVMWPFGYSARLIDGVIELLDSSGTFVAREGDAIEMAGGLGANGLFYACAEGLHVVTR